MWQKCWRWYAISSRLFLKLHASRLSCAISLIWAKGHGGPSLAFFADFYALLSWITTLSDFRRWFKNKYGRWLHLTVRRSLLKLRLLLRNEHVLRHETQYWWRIFVLLAAWVTGRRGWPWGWRVLLGGQWTTCSTFLIPKHLNPIWLWNYLRI